MNWTLTNFCEFDKYAEKSYCAIHNVSTDLNLGDITKVDENNIADFDLMTWGFPCTDISIAGLQKGFVDEDGNKTRTGLYEDGLRILKAKQPKFSIIENVAALTQIKFKKEFRQMFKDLDNAGYNSYAEVLNAKHYGVPQNRERVFIVSIRKDIDVGYTFPQPFYKKMSIKDIKLDVVDEKYYMSNDILDKLENSSFMQEKLRLQTGDICSTLMARDYKDPKLVYANEVQQVGNIVDTGNWDNPQRGRIYSDDGCSPALNTCGGGGLEVKILETPYTVAQRGRNPNNTSDRTVGAPTMQMLEPNLENISNCLTTVQKDNYLAETVIIDDTQGFDGVREYTDISPTLRAERQGLKVYNSNRIRKLTPLECFRLMAFDDADYYRAQSVNSDSQLYKQCGNSIVVNIPYYILKKMQERYPEHFELLRVSSFFSGIGAFEKALDRLQDGWVEPIEGKEIVEQMSLF